MIVMHLDRLCGAEADTPRALWKTAVGGVIKVHFEARADGVGLGPDGDAAAGVRVLGRRGAADTIHRASRVVIDETRDGAALVVKAAVGAGGAVVDGEASAADSGDVGLRAGRADLVARGILGGEFLGILPAHKLHLLVA